MDKKIVILTGSPRRRGNSARLAGALDSALREEGDRTVRFDTAQLTIGGCRACGGCYSKGKPCLFDRDDFNRIAGEIETADGFALVTPVYWYTFPAQLKAVIDRFYAFWNAKHLFTGKECALVACCADAPVETFDGMLYAWRESIALLQGENLGETLFPGLSGLEAVSPTEADEKMRLLARKFQA